MKSLKILILLLVAALSSTVAVAQKELQIQKVFDGSIVPHREMIETKVRGQQLAAYHLSFYHAIKCIASTAEAAKIRALVDTDTEKHEVQLVQEKKSNSQTTKLLQFKRARAPYPFIFYVERPASSGKRAVTLIYAETDRLLSDVDDLRQFFSK